MRWASNADVGAFTALFLTGQTAGQLLLGWVADRWGVSTALWISALTPLLAFALTRLLPAPRDAAA